MARSPDPESPADGSIAGRPGALARGPSRSWARPAQAALLSGALALSLSGCATLFGRESARQYVDDATITTAVKSKVAADPRLHPSHIDVETARGVVALSGSVPSTADKRLAGELAREAPGVREVRNDIAVGK